jgi:hypothetical protein
VIRVGGFYKSSMDALRAAADADLPVGTKIVVKQAAGNPRLFVWEACTDYAPEWLHIARDMLRDKKPGWERTTDEHGGRVFRKIEGAK